MQGKEHTRTGRGVRAALPSSAANHLSHNGRDKVGVELFLEEIPKGFNVCPVFHKEKHKHCF